MPEQAMPLRVELALPHMRMLQKSDSVAGWQMPAFVLWHGRWELVVMCMLAQNEGLDAEAFDER